MFSSTPKHTQTCTHTAKLLCLYTIAFSALLLIKVDSYTCWIKRNITMMYFSCIIYDGWPARAMVPEVICLPIHYSRQIAGSLCRVSSFILLLLCNFFFFVCVFQTWALHVLFTVRWLSGFPWCSCIWDCCTVALGFDKWHERFWSHTCTHTLRLHWKAFELLLIICMTIVTVADRGR